MLLMAKRGESTAWVMESQLARLEKKIDDLLASVDADVDGKVDGKVPSRLGIAQADTRVAQSDRDRSSA